MRNGDDTNATSSFGCLNGHYKHKVISSTLTPHTQQIFNSENSKSRSSRVSFDEGCSNCCAMITSRRSGRKDSIDACCSGSSARKSILKRTRSRSDIVTSCSSGQQTMSLLKNNPAIILEKSPMGSPLSKQTFFQSNKSNDFIMTVSLAAAMTKVGNDTRPDFDTSRCEPLFQSPQKPWSESMPSQSLSSRSVSKKEENQSEHQLQQFNRLDRIIRVMQYHPEYMEHFLRMHDYLINGNGPLPRPFRHYLAIMAASCHQCSYLVHLHATQFLLEDGNLQWLQGIKHAPKKLQELSTLNSLLAHQPWLVTHQHIDALIASFSLNELGHALALLCHFHALSGFVHSSGLNADPSDLCFLTDSSNNNLLNFSLNSSDSLSSQTNATYNESEVRILMEKMQHIKNLDLDPQEIVRRYEIVTSQSFEIIVSSKKTSDVKEDARRFLDDPNFGYKDFTTNKKSCKFATQISEEISAERITSTPNDDISLTDDHSQYQIETSEAFCALSTSDYPWEDAISLANMLYSNLGDLIENKIATAYNLTYRTCGENENVDTSAFRRSIWNYIQLLFGIFHDDYNYMDANNLLDRALKKYVKTVACYPERVTKIDYDSFMQGFRDSEKVHVNLMILEARLQAELLYVLRAIQRRTSSV